MQYTPDFQGATGLGVFGVSMIDSQLLVISEGDDVLTCMEAQWQVFARSERLGERSGSLTHDIDLYRQAK